MSPTVRRTALVTGASTGIGRATAIDLAQHGYDVALADLPGVALAEVAGLVEAAGGRALPVELDLRSLASIEASIAAGTAGLGSLDVLVNNAGTTLRGPAVDIDWDDWDTLISVNLKGHYFMSTRFARWCIAQQRPGAIVSTASTHGFTGIAGQSVYGISKGGIIQMTRMLAVEWAAQGIRVNAVAPATVLTPSRSAMLSDPARRQMMLDRLPTGHFPTAEEIAYAIRFLAAPENLSITGHILPVDSGLLAV
jgi:NAD(P)-dependent dehydrogenase (short-subunit alcohol dehydrogenase family)